jgi:hypothetical protein
MRDEIRTLSPGIYFRESNRFQFALHGFHGPAKLVAEIARELFPGFVHFGIALRDILAAIEKYDLSLDRNPPRSDDVICIRHPDLDTPARGQPIEELPEHGKGFPAEMMLDDIVGKDESTSPTAKFSSMLVLPMSMTTSTFDSTLLPSISIKTSL